MALAIAILGFAPGLLDPFTPLKAAALRVLGLALLGAFLGETLAGLASRNRAAPRRREPLAPSADARSGDSPAGAPDRPRVFAPAVALDLAAVSWVAASMLSTLGATSPRVALLGEIGQREGLLTTLALAGLYAGARRSHATPAHGRRTMSVTLACAALAAGYAALQLVGLDPVAWATPAIYTTAGGTVRRAFGSLGNPILLGNLLAALLAAAVVRLACCARFAWPLAAAIALLAVTIAATLSRGAWLAAAAGVAAALATTHAMGGERAGRRIGLAFAAVAIPTVVSLATVLRAPLMARLAEAGSQAAVSGAARAEIARGALAMWRAHPWLGGGPDSFGLLFPAVQTPAFWRLEWLGAPVHAHSAALQTIATLGAVGALAGLAWLAALGWALARERKTRVEREERAALACALLALAVGGIVNPVGLAGAACFVVFAALAARGAIAPAPAGPPLRARTARWVPLAAGIGVAAVLVVTGAREMRSLAAAARARTALDQSTTVAAGDRARLAGVAARHAARAASLAAGEDELWRLACDAHLARGEAAIARLDSSIAEGAARDARAAADQALALVPRRAVNHDRLGNALTMQARVALPGPGRDALADSADAAFARASALAPADGLILTDQARGQLLLGRPDRALATARRIVALYPAAATGHALEGGALLAIGWSDAARAALLMARDARWEDGSESQQRAVEDLLRALDRPAAAP